MNDFESGFASDIESLAYLVDDNADKDDYAVLADDADLPLFADEIAEELEVERDEDFDLDGISPATPSACICGRWRASRC